MKNRNASASAFGWDFQVNAAILLMLENIEKAEKIRVEGKDEDIEITLNDKKRIYSQVKAVLKPDDYSHVIEKLTSSLETLNQSARNGDGFLYTYITNSPNPFNNQKTMSYFTSNTHLYFDELPDIAKNKINDILNKKGFTNIDTKRLDIRVIPFYGDDLKNRYKEIKNTINDFLRKLDIQADYLVTEILTTWQRDFFQNSTQTNKDIVIDKKKMIWPLIVLLTNNVTANCYKNDFNEEECTEIERKYKFVINDQTMLYEFVTKVITDHIKCNESIKFFVDNYWKHYLERLVDIDTDESEKKILMKIILYRILYNRKYISKIKEGVNL